VADVEGLRDPAVAQTLAETGYARLGVVLDADEVTAARAIFDEALRRLDAPLGDAWFPTILLPDEDVRTFISEGLEGIVGPHLDEVIDATALELMRLHFSVKPPSEMSELGPHQDFSIVDERSATSLYVWIALEDMDEANGTLHVVPGSHRFANEVRSQHVPATFDDVLDEVHRASVRLDCKAGELVIMVSGVIHHSPPNRTSMVRLAAHGILKPVHAPLVFFYADERTPEGKVECYELDLDTYVRQVHEGRPDPAVERTGLADRPPPMTPERFAAGLAAVSGDPTPSGRPHRP
jgi:hypothetical protein